MPNGSPAAESPFVGRRLSAEEIATVLVKHRAWRLGKPDGSDANLSDANLSDANLSGADLSGAGRKLESVMGSCAAGALIYHASTGRVPDFYASNADALADIRERAESTEVTS